MRYNRTNFVSNGFAARLLKAMRGALTDGYAHYVENRQGKRWLRVNVVTAEGSDSGYAFQFLANNGQEVGHLLLSALFVWDDVHEREFSALMNELYTRNEHPLITARRAVMQAEAESNSATAPEVKNKPWKSAIKHALGYLTAAAVGVLGGNAYVAARDLLPGVLP